MKLQPTKVYRPCNIDEVEDAIATIDVGISKMEVPIKVENDKYLLSKEDIANLLFDFIKQTPNNDKFMLQASSILIQGDYLKQILNHE